MSDNPLNVVTRGADSSGRPLRGTVQMFECHARLNDKLDGALVPIQGSFNAGVSASAGTHDKAGCWDWRTWNLSWDQQLTAMRLARGTLALALFPRTLAQGFDPHFHGTLLSDAPMTPETAWQRSEFLAGRNMLASRGADTFYRPSPLVTVYPYGGEPMTLTKAQEGLLKGTAENVREVEAMLRRFIPAEVARDADERAAEKSYRQRLSSRLAGVVDRLGEADRAMTGNTAEVVAVRAQLRAVRADVLQALREDPTTDGTPDDPTPEAVKEAHAAAPRNG